MTALIPLYLATGFWFVIGPFLVGAVIGFIAGRLSNRRRQW